MTSAVIQRWAIAILCIHFTGCTVCENARRTVSIEPHIFYWKKDKRRSLAVYSSWADQIWAEESQGCPQLAGRSEYAIGFRDGFVDYVYAGGTGEPPPVPPRHLWNVDFRSEEGHQRAEDWFAGYRHGAGIARDGGFRSLATIRSSILGIEQPTGPLIYGENTWQGDGVDGQDQWPTTEPLPTPAEGPVLPPNTIEAEGDEDSSTDPPADESESREPETRPSVPPPPRNLPPTTPRNLPPPGGEEPPLQLNGRDDRPADDPADLPRTERETIDRIEPAPLSIPLDTTEEPAADPMPEPTTLREPASNSLRFRQPHTVSGEPPRVLPALSSRPLRFRAESMGDRMPTRVETAIRLTAAESPTKPVVNKPQTSTIRIRAAAGESQNSTTSGTIRITIP
jgi:hypothetical protein